MTTVLTKAFPQETPSISRVVLGKKRILIVGGGFAGIAAARALKRADVEITLVDRRNHHIFQPLLYQVATAVLSPFATRADPVGCAPVAWTTSIEAGQKKKHAAEIAPTTPRAPTVMSVRRRFMSFPALKVASDRSAGGGC
jgi:2-polyprenyl-6-methoxyphenol hydroxylase-like FAD-dependent oxidoreductase